MSLRMLLIDWCLIALFWMVIPALAQEHHEGHSAAELNRQFQNPNLDISRFVDRFETDSREIFAQRRKIVEAVSLHHSPEMTSPPARVASTDRTTWKPGHLT